MPRTNVIVQSNEALKKSRPRRKVSVDLSQTPQQRLDVFLRQENVIVNQVHVPIPVREVQLSWAKRPAITDDSPRVEMFDSSLLRWAQSDSVVLELDPLAQAGVWTEEEMAMRRLQRQVQLRHLYEQEYFDLQQREHSIQVEKRERRAKKASSTATVAAAAAAAAAVPAATTTSSPVRGDPSGGSDTQPADDDADIDVETVGSQPVSMASAPAISQAQTLPTAPSLFVQLPVTSKLDMSGFPLAPLWRDATASVEPRRLLALRRYGVRRRLTAAIRRALPRTQQQQQQQQQAAAVATAPKPALCAFLSTLALDETASASASTSASGRSSTLSASAVPVSATPQGACSGAALPNSRFCLHHILSDPNQRLYVRCSAADEQCTQPVPRFVAPTLCRAHRYMTADETAGPP